MSQIGELGRLSNRFGFLMDGIVTVINITVIGLSCYLVIHHQIKIGEMIAIFSMVSRIFPAVMRLSQINIKIQEAKIAFNRMYDFTCVQLEFDKCELNAQYIHFESLEVQNIAFRFPDRAAVIKDVSFSIKKGEIVALLGESGCGKSTILQILQKFYNYEAGDIKINKVSLAELPTEQWRNTIATVAQEVKIFNGSVLYNLCLSDDPKKMQEVTQFAMSLGFGDFFKGLPLGVLTIVGEEGIILSGGQKQIIAIVRAFFRKPQLLILDEATAAMDRNTERAILNLFLRLKLNISILMITHW